MTLCYITYVFIDHADDVFDIIGVGKNVCKQGVNFNNRYDETGRGRSIGMFENNMKYYIIIRIILYYYYSQ